MSGEHKTIPVQVWADVDEGIAPLVKYLNTIPDIRTHASCQGTIGEGGPEPYRAQVLVSYNTEEAKERLSNEFDLTEVFMATAYVHPREGWAAPEDKHGQSVEQWIEGRKKHRRLIKKLSRRERSQG